MSATNIPGFSREITQPEYPCFGIFGDGGTGKTRLCATATAWAQERGKVPGWIVCDQNTRQTVKAVHEELGLDLPYMNPVNFITQKEALALAVNTDYAQVQKTYEAVVKRVFDASVALAAHPNVDPIIFDSGSTIWDWIAFSHFGRKENVGKSRVWGPPKQDWTDLMDGARESHLVLITLKSKDEYRNDARTGRQTWDGPVHLKFTTTSIMRTNFDSQKQVEDYRDRFSLDVVESHDNVGLAGVNGVLEGQAITLESLMAVLRPGE